MPSLRPDSHRPVIAKPRRTLTVRAVDALDALLVLAAQNDARQALGALPMGDALLKLIGRRPLAVGKVLELRLPNRAQTLLVIGVLDEQAGTFARLELAGRMARAALAGQPRVSGVVAVGFEGAAADAAVEAGLSALLAADFRLPSFRSQPDARSRLEVLQPFGAQALDIRRIAAVAEGNDLARWLTAMPPNLLTPGRYRRLVQDLSRDAGLRTRFYDERALKRLGAGAFLAVTAGSPTRDAGVLHVQYRPDKARGAPLALVGKGLCFDTGGTNLKAHKGMLDMHTDMAGSAVAFATVLTLARLGYHGPVDAWLALAQNHIGPNAYKPQDLVTALDGTTIQVIHTDAEGRMALADTLALASRGKPSAIVDLATLTGACVSALTERYSGAFTNRPELRGPLERAGQASGERVWCFPLDDDFDVELESKVADVIQCPVEGKGDHIYAARFLKRFVGKGIPWVHLDLSSATRAGGLAHVPTDVTGFGVRLLSTLALDGYLT